jgi:hypothetical protein
MAAWEAAGTPVGPCSSQARVRAPVGVLQQPVAVAVEAQGVGLREGPRAPDRAHARQAGRVAAVAGQRVAAGPGALVDARTLLRDSTTCRHGSTDGVGQGGFQRSSRLMWCQQQLSTLAPMPMHSTSKSSIPVRRPCMDDQRVAVKASTDACKHITTNCVEQPASSSRGQHNSSTKQSRRRMQAYRSSPAYDDLALPLSGSNPLPA